MHIHVGCSIVYGCPQPTPMLFVLRPSLNTNHYLIEERRITSPVVPVNPYMDSYGNEIWRLVAPDGNFQIDYDALVAVPPTPDIMLPDLPKTAIENLPYDVIIYTLPSRLCPSPFMTAKVVAAIYWQALRLWAKRVPFHAHPKKLAPAGSGRASRAPNLVQERTR